MKNSGILSIAALNVKKKLIHMYVNIIEGSVIPDENFLGKYVHRV